MEIVYEFFAGGFKIKWINAISKFGYIRIEKISDDSIDDTVDMWLIGEKISVFLKETSEIQAINTAYEFINRIESPKSLFVFPRYPNDYEDNNETYQIAESGIQKQTSSIETIYPHAKALEILLSK